MKIPNAAPAVQTNYITGLCVCARRLPRTHFRKQEFESGIFCGATKLSNHFEHREHWVSKIMHHVVFVVLANSESDCAVSGQKIFTTDGSYNTEQECFLFIMG